jgi:hypothetical protein
VIKAILVNKTYGTVIKRSLINAETEEALTSEQVIHAFNRLEILGVYVVRRYDRHKGKLAGPAYAPTTGMITAITDTRVDLGNYGVPRDRFFEWYELD